MMVMLTIKNFDSKVSPSKNNGDSSGGSNKDDEERNEISLAHYNQYFLECTCPSPCNFQGCEEQACSFGMINDAEIILIRRSMMLSFIAPKGDFNESNICDAQSAQKRKENLRDFDDIEQSTTIFEIHG